MIANIFLNPQIQTGKLYMLTKAQTFYAKMQLALQSIIITNFHFLAIKCIEWSLLLENRKTRHTLYKQWSPLLISWLISSYKTGVSNSHPSKGHILNAYRIYLRSSRGFLDNFFLIKKWVGSKFKLENATNFGPLGFFTN